MAFDVVIEPASGSIEITGSSLTFIGEKSGSLFQIQQSQNANLLVAGDISASGTVYGGSFQHSPTGHITASGNISASGDLYVRSGSFGGAGTTSGQTLTVEGTISASGNVLASGYKIDGYNGVTFSGTNIQFGYANNWTGFEYGRQDTDNHTFTGNITASGDISASGDLYVRSGSFKDINVEGHISASGDIFNTGQIHSDAKNGLPGIFVKDNDSHIISSSGQSANDLKIIMGDIGEGQNGTTFTLDDSGTGAVKINKPLSINTNTPATNMELTVAGDISASGDIFLEQNKYIKWENTNNSSIRVNSNQMYIEADGDMHLSPDGDLSIRVGSTEYASFDGSAESLGIGNDTPPEKLTVEGNISASGGYYGSRTFETGSITAVGNNSGADIVYFGAGSLTTGTLYYLATNGTWTAADASDNTAGADELLGIALGSSATSNGVLLRGVVNVTGISGLTNVGRALYISTTAGDVTETAPSSNNEIVRIVGYVLNANDTMYFNPDSTWVKVTA